MRLPELYLLKEGDTVVVNGRERTVKEKAKDGTIKIGNTHRYYSEVQSVDDYKDKSKHNNYKSYSFTDK